MFRKTAICMAIFATIFGVVKQANKEQKSLEPDFTIDVYGSDDGTVLLVPSGSSVSLNNGKTIIDWQKIPSGDEAGTTFKITGQSKNALNVVVPGVFEGFNSKDVTAKTVLSIFEDYNRINTNTESVLRTKQRQPSKDISR